MFDVGHGWGRGFSISIPYMAKLWFGNVCNSSDVLFWLYSCEFVAKYLSCGTVVKKKSLSWTGDINYEDKT